MTQPNAAPLPGAMPGRLVRAGRGEQALHAAE